MSTPTKMLPQEAAPVLTAMDRCDNCGAQAKVEVARLKAGEKADNLMFCGHHVNKHAEALDAAGYFTVVNDLGASVCTS